MPGQPNIRDPAPAGRRVSGVRRAAPRDYQAQSQLARSSAAGDDHRPEQGGVDPGTQTAPGAGAEPAR